MKMDRKLTTIQISVDVRDLLKNVGRKDETYDDVILRLIDLLDDAPKPREVEQ